MNIKERIQMMCDANHISIAELERTVGIANATISRWSTSSPNIAGVVKVADYFKCSVDYIIGRKEEQYRTKESIETFLGQDYKLVHSILELSDYKKELIAQLVGFIK